ncbi:DUF1801 domain-containing protein [Flavobacterium terrisoli]|uniref:DUF1801 domain-containing protein n=1 Tax=Flavobacterium terrisoli TaxID=3242195 RepID=UPI00254284E2|nr:DUF1801 domain-containing protein [Flavobacterium buctense]
MSNNEVNSYLDKLEHPLKDEIILLRDFIKGDFPALTEIIKWNAPSYQYNGIDFLTFNLARPNDIKLIIHRGAKKQEMPSSKLIEDQSGLLKWAANDRAVITFTQLAEITNHRENLKSIIQNWMGKL